MEEVERAGEGQEEDPRPHHYHPHPEGEWPKRVRRHRGIPCEKGGTVDDAHDLTIRDGIEASFDGKTLTEGTLPNSEIAQRIKEAMEPLRDDAGAALDFVYLVLGHPLMRPEL